MRAEEELIPPDKVPIRVVEVVASVSYLKDGCIVIENFTDVSEAEKFFNSIEGRAKLVVHTDDGSWECIKEKGERTEQVGEHTEKLRIVEEKIARAIEIIEQEGVGIGIGTGYEKVMDLLSSARSILRRVMSEAD